MIYLKMLISLCRQRRWTGFIITLELILDLCRGAIRGFPGVLIGKNVIIRDKENISIGKFTRIEAYCELNGYGAMGLKIGSRCKIGRFTVLRVPGDPLTPGAGIAISEGTTFGEYCFVGGAGLVTIGRNNSFGQYVSIHPQNHLSATKSGPTESLGVRVGNENWIGAKATLLDGVSIGDNNIVGAATLVSRNIETDQKHVGVPNRRI